MSLADKITLLRKQQGWSQIDLADRLDVSRQSVSKWEMGQAVPELDKIIKLSELFDVTCDYLLKDNVSDNPPPPEPEPEPDPQPEPEPVLGPESLAKETKKKWPTWRWIAVAILAIIFSLSVVITIAAAVLSFASNSAEYTEEDSAWIDALPTPTPGEVSAIAEDYEP